MTVTFTLYSVVVLILILNSILEHLFNWVFRIIHRDIHRDSSLSGNESFGASLILYAIKWFVVLVVLSKIME